MRSRGSWAVGLVLVGVLASAGCTAEGTAAPTTPRPTTSSHATVTPTPDPSPTPTPSSAPSVAPTSGPDQDVTKPPARPDALDGPATEDNAVAVAKYFTALYSYIVATGDFTEWDALSGPDCRFCESGRESAEEVHNAGNHGTGGAVDLGFGSASAQGDGTFVVDVQFTEYPSQTVNPQGVVVEDFPGTLQLKATMVLSHDGRGWRVEGVKIDEFGSGT
nr:DUF6318 family protein [Cellulomonas uda]